LRDVAGTAAGKEISMDGTLRLTLVLSTALQLTAPAAPSDFAQSTEKLGPQVEPPPAIVTRLPLDIVFVEQRLYEAPTALNFAVVTPYDPDNREAGIELRCNTQAVATTTWTLDEKSNTVREFRWKLPDENCLYELVAILVRTRDYVYLYQMVPSRAWLSHKMPSRQFGRGSRF
jgi:hypothetical protein